MSGIHQIYCTHCTHGSSALERREGELAHRMLGYSARAGSVDAAELRRYYRQIDRYTYYYLPRDTPGEEKLRLTAATAPRRLIYLPSIGGLQIVGQVVYRQMDTEGRPGSYFAHVLFRDEQQQKTPWPVLDCLKLWAARVGCAKTRRRFRSSCGRSSRSTRFVPASRSPSMIACC